MRFRTIGLLAFPVVLGALPIAAARADTSWNTTGSYTTTVAGTWEHEGLASTDPNWIRYGNQIEFQSGGSPLYATSYFVTSNSSSSTLQAANIEVYQGSGYGIGVTSKTVGSSYIEDVGNSPGHTVDNQGVYDMVAFQLPSANFDVTKITLNTFSTSQYSSGHADFTVFVGGNSQVTSLSSLAGVTLGSLTSTYGFTELNYSHATDGTFNINSGNVTGQYLIVAASLTNTWKSDDFKIAQVVGNSSTHVPEPSTLLVFGSGGIMLIFFNRKRRFPRC
jgi:hypothetical protein